MEDINVNVHRVRQVFTVKLTVTMNVKVILVNMMVLVKINLETTRVSVQYTGQGKIVIFMIPSSKEVWENSHLKVL